MGAINLKAVPDPMTMAQVLALAPDPASERAARGLATPTQWSDAGCTGLLLWGRCRGSGQKPYQTVVELPSDDSATPAYACSCPSRKFPCKHVLALLLVWSGGQLTPAPEAIDFAVSWLEQRRARTPRTEAGAEQPESRTRTAEDVARLIERRSEKVSAGLEELDQWLSDQVRTGLAGTERHPYAHFDTIAARMIDAQAPGIAGKLRSLAAIPGLGDSWPGQLLSEYALLRLLITAHRQIDTLDPDLAATVRTHIGFQFPKEPVLAGPAVHDQWLVIGRRDSVEGMLTTRRTWLVGAHSRRFALILTFAHGGQPLDDSLAPLTSVEADLHFYPGRGQHRALVGNRADAAPLDPLALRPLTLGELSMAWAAALADDPWLTVLPTVIKATPQLSGTEPQSWSVVDQAGSQLALGDTGLDPWQLLAISGGSEIAIAGELSARGLLPLAAWSPDGALRL